MNNFFEDTLARHEQAIVKAKQSVDSGLSIAYEAMQQIKYETPLIADRLIPTGQGTILLKLDKIKKDAEAALNEIDNKKPGMKRASITENGNILIERASEVFSKIDDLQKYVHDSEGSKPAQEAIQELGDMKDRLNTGINMAVTNYSFLHERLEIYKALKDELDTQRNRQSLPPSEHIREDKKDIISKIKKHSGIPM